MNVLKRILKNNSIKAGSYYLIGNLFNKAIAFITIPIFTRLMTTTDYGIVNTYMSWVSILSVVVGLSLGNSIRSVFTDFRKDLEGYISSILFLSLINFVFTSGVIILISYLFFKEMDLILVALCLIQSFMTFIINTVTIYYMMGLEYIKRTFLLAAPNLIIVTISVVFLLNLNESKYFGRIIPAVLVTTVFGGYYLIKFIVKGRVLVNAKYWKYALKLSLPLVFHGLSINILSTSDRTMITLFRNASETGVYSLVYSMSMVASVITTSLESVWIPWFTKKLNNDDKGIINRNVKYYIEIVMIVMIVILMIGPELLMFMAPKEYWIGKILIPPILLASFFIFLYSISVDLEYYYKSTKIIAVNTIIAALINLVLNMIFIPSYGAIGAAFTTVIAYVVSFGIHYNAARKLDNKLFPFNIYLKPILIMISAVVFSYLTINKGLIRWGLTVIGIMLYIVISLKKHRFKDLLTKYRGVINE